MKKKNGIAQKSLLRPNSLQHQQQHRHQPTKPDSNHSYKQQMIIQNEIYQIIIINLTRKNKELN